MTCASCVRRIEKALDRVEGVRQANVNLATEKAHVVYDPHVASPERMRAAVEKAGYGVREFSPSADGIRAPIAAVEKTPTEPAGEVMLPIQGMTCASCVRRVEKALGRVDGVSEANVNLATEQAHVVFDPSRASVGSMRAAVEKAGYAIGKLPELSTPGTTASTSPSTEDAQDIERQRELDDLRRGWSVSLAVGVAMMALAYAPLNVPMDVVAPLMLIAATVVQFWAGRPIYQAAWASARHGATNMDTLIAVGTSVAYAYSAFVTLWPHLAVQWGFHETSTSRQA
jgi:Cu+-exporting ATPase